MEIQTRSEANGYQSFDSLKSAFEAAKEDATIWQISFFLGKEKVRLVKQYGFDNEEWICQPMS